MSEIQSQRKEYQPPPPMSRNQMLTHPLPSDLLPSEGNDAATRAPPGLLAGEEAVKAYFQAYSGFVYNPSERAARQFDRLVREKGWHIGSREFTIALAELNDALLRQFDPSSKGHDLSTTVVEQVAPETSETEAQGEYKSETESTEGQKVEGHDQEEVGRNSSGKLRGNEKQEEQELMDKEAKVTSEKERKDEVKKQRRGSRKRRKERSNEKKPQGQERRQHSTEQSNKAKAQEGKGRNPAIPAPNWKVPGDPSPQRPHTPSDFSDSSSDVEPNYLDDFFREYCEFDSRRNRTESVADQLGQLKQQERWWGPRKHLWKIALGKYQKALVLQFNTSFGTDVNDLETWHRVLKVMDVELPKTVRECRLLIDSVHVNIVDLVDAVLNPGSSKVTLFPSEEALSRYTINSKKFFPKEHAYAGGVLRYLLRHIL